MNTFLFEVKVPFEPLRYEKLGSSSIAQLPHSFELYGITVHFDSENNIYFARLEVPASNISEAKMKATEVIRLILSVIATSDLGFRINYGTVLTARSIGEFSEASSLTPPEEYCEILTLLEHLHLEEHIHVDKKLVNLEFEKKALSWIDSWPEWLKVALELNYLSVLSRDEKPSFVILYSALEVMVLGIEGSATAIIAQNLQKEQAESLLRDMRELLKKYYLSNNHIDRLISRIQETQTKGTVNRILDTLQKLKIEVETKEVNLVVRQRGSIIHTGQSSDYEKFLKAKGLLHNWVQTGLRNTLEQKVNEF